MRYFVLILLVLNFVSVVEADCQDNQIDINSASLEKLEEIIWVGAKTAPKIIDARPFDSVDDLVRVKGIAEKTLEKIKNQGLACVGNEKEETEKLGTKPTENPNEKMKILEEIPPETETFKEKIISAPRKEKIILNSAVDNPAEVVYESKNSKILKYLPYAFSAFLIFVIIVLFLDK